MNNMDKMMLNSKTYVMGVQTCNNYKTCKIIKHTVQFLMTQSITFKCLIMCMVQLTCFTHLYRTLFYDAHNVKKRRVTKTF